MFQIDNASAATTKPASTPPGAAGFFTDGNPAVGEAATIVPAEWLNAIMMEVCNAITATGVTLNKASFTQLTTAIKALAGNTGVTPPQFDSSTNTATTRFVTRFGKQYSGAYNYGGATAGLISHIGSMLFFGGGGPNSYGLPGIAANAIPVGATITIENLAGVPVTVTASGTDRIQTPTNGGTATITQAGGTTIEYTFTGNNAGINYWTAAGTGAISSSAEFAGVMGGNGYVKHPSGLIFQWGTMSGNSVGQLGWVFPLTFPHNYFSSMGVYVNGGIGPQGSAVTCAEASGTASTGSVNYIVSGAGAGINAPQVRLLALGY
jgi:hypothetical protein